MKRLFAAAVMVGAGYGAVLSGESYMHDFTELPAQLASTAGSAMLSGVGIGNTKELAPPSSPNKIVHYGRVVLNGESLSPVMPLPMSNDFVRIFEFGAVSVVAGTKAVSGGRRKKSK